MQTLQPSVRPDDSLSQMLRKYGMPETEIALMHDRAAFAKKAAFCSLSMGYFSRLAEDKITDPTEHKQAHDAHAHFSALDQSARNRLGNLIWQSQAMRKPSKMGQIASEARQIAGPHAPFAMACMLDNMALSMAGSLDSLKSKVSLISIIARHIAGAPEDILVGLATRCCYQPDPDLLGALLAFGALAQGSDVTRHSPLAMAARQHGAAGTMTKEKSKALECMSLLLAHGARVDSPDDHARCALSVAAGANFWQACHLLLDHGADPFFNGPDGPPIDLLLSMEQTSARAHGIQEANALAQALPDLSASPARKPRI